MSKGRVSNVTLFYNVGKLPDCYHPLPSQPLFFFSNFYIILHHHPRIIGTNSKGSRFKRDPISIIFDHSENFLLQCQPMSANVNICQQNASKC